MASPNSPAFNPLPPRAAFARERGFTLAEVALALAIFSFALVSMLGMLSVGLRTSRKASLQTAAANIIAAIATDARAAKLTEASDSYSFETPLLGIRGTVALPDRVLTLDSSPELRMTDGAALVSGQMVNELGVAKLFKVTLEPTPKPNTFLKVTVYWPESAAPPRIPAEGSMSSLITLPSID
ncbi:MAG: hypothetical protein RLZZ142_1892 [Verrucomicrobiota bacterium]|jgi:prepilin-type N-terminal cleavage/methylation domain-containing protein